MNTKRISLTSHIFAVALVTIAINNAQAAAALDSKTLGKASNLLEEKTRIRKAKNEIKSRTKEKNTDKKHIRTCDTYSQKILHKKAAKYKADINQLAKRYKVSPHLIMAVITVESCFRESVLSPQGAVGLMQLIPATASRFGTDNRYNPHDNIRAGTRYLQYLLKRFNGDLKLVAAAYNAGEGAVTRHKGIPPYKETRAYVNKVLNAYNKLSKRKQKNKKVSVRTVKNKQKIKTLRPIHQKRRQQLIGSKNLAFTTPEREQIARILASERGIPKQSLIKQVL